MKRYRIIAITIALTAVGTVAFGQDPREPRVFLSEIRAADAKKSPTDRAVKRIESDAQKALTTEILPITSKTAVPPSGDKHDYMSQAPYFWRDPKSATGLPYIRRDGERNPEIKQYPDEDLMNKMIATVERLAVGYFVLRDDKYAERARQHLRMWFIDPKTKMNPNLEFAQAIPGANTGRGFGIIETRALVRLVDSIGLLAGTPSWTPADQDGVEAWFSKYLTWLTTSKNGKEESAAKNNHGTHYDVQVVSIALFLRNEKLAISTLETAKQKRIAAQIEPDGSQPLELARTRSWDYSVMNLDGLISLARLAENVGIDLWNYQTPDGRSIQKAIAFLEPFTHEGKKWPYQQISIFQPERFAALLRRAEGVRSRTQKRGAPASGNKKAAPLR